MGNTRSATRKSHRPAPTRARGTQDAALTAVFRDVLRSARDLLEIDDPLDAELWGSSLQSTWHELILIDDEPDRLFGRALVRHAARSNRPEGLALLLALAATAPPGLAKAARAAAAPLAARVPRPGWANLVGRAELVEAHLAAHPLGGQDALLATFRHAGWPVHMLCILIDDDVLGGAVKDAFVVDDPRERLAEWRSLPDFVVTRIGPEELAGRVLRGIEIGDRFVDGPFSEDYKESRRLLQARMLALPGGWEAVEPTPMLEADRRRLVEDFLASPEAHDVVARAPREVEEVAGTLVDFRCDYGDGEALR